MSVGEKLSNVHSALFIAAVVGGVLSGRAGGDGGDGGDGGGTPDDGTNGGDSDNGDDSDMGNDDERTAAAVEKLVAIEQRNNPGLNSEDASDSATFTLSAGEKAVIEISPPSGYDLRVERLYVDRRDGVNYHFEASGVLLSRTNQWNGNPARKVQQNETVILEVENATNNNYVFDYEAEMWKEAV